MDSRERERGGERRRGALGQESERERERRFPLSLASPLRPRPAARAPGSLSSSCSSALADHLNRLLDRLAQAAMSTSNIISKRRK